MAGTRKSKSKKPPTMIRLILGRNVETLRDRVFSDERTVTARNRKLGEKIGVKLAQVQRICSGELGTSVDTIEWLADALKVRPQDLLTPYFGTSGMNAPASQPEPMAPADEALLQRRAD